MTSGYHWVYAVHHPAAKELVYRSEDRKQEAAVEKARDLLAKEGVRALVVHRGVAVFDTNVDTDAEGNNLVGIKIL